MITAIADFILRVYYFVMAAIMSLCAAALYYTGYDPDNKED